MWVVVLTALFVAYCIYMQHAEYAEIQKQEFEAEYQALSDKFGVCTADVKLRDKDTYLIDSHLLVFEKSQTIVLYGKEYLFSEILDFSLVDDALNQTAAAHNYTMYIKVNSQASPTITIQLGRNTKRADELAALLNAIIAKGRGIQKV